MLCYGMGKRGLGFYEGDEACPRCGGTLRYVRNGGCVPCNRMAAKQYYKAVRPFVLEDTKAWHTSNRERHIAMMRDVVLRRNFGINREQYDQILASQNGVCAICCEPCSSGKSLAVDHCHDAGTVRGLLCLNCNTGLGKFKDDPDRLTRAAAYLKRAIKNQD